MDGDAAGEADVVNTTPTTEYGLVVRFPSLPAGSNVIGGVTGSGNFTVVQPTGTNLHIVCDSGCGGGTQYDEDTVSAAADKLTMAGVVRKDTAATLVDLDGDRTQLQVDATGRLWVNGSGVTQPVSGTFWQATQPVSGTFWQATQPISGTVTANAGSGTFTVGGTVNIGTFPDNEPINVAQIGGVAVSKPCARARSSVAVNVSASGSTELVGLTGGQTIYVCGYVLVANGTVDVKVVYGTGANCVTGSTDLTGAMPWVVNSGVAAALDDGAWFETAVSNALCLNLSAAVAVRGHVRYVKF